jgi:sugar/nucleoside kinase (ribokinase family)
VSPLRFAASQLAHAALRLLLAHVHTGVVTRGPLGCVAGCRAEGGAEGEVWGAAAAVAKPFFSAVAVAVGDPQWTGRLPVATGPFQGQRRARVALMRWDTALVTERASVTSRLQEGAEQRAAAQALLAVPAVPGVELADTTGAGDHFTSGCG